MLSVAKYYYEGLTAKDIQRLKLKMFNAKYQFTLLRSILVYLEQTMQYNSNNILVCCKKVILCFTTGPHFIKISICKSYLWNDTCGNQVQATY